MRILREMAIVALVGRGFFRYAGLSRRIFDSLADVNVVMISFAASDVNVSVVVEEADAERAVHALHREFFSDPQRLAARHRRKPQSRTTEGTGLGADRVRRSQHGAERLRVIGSRPRTSECRSHGLHHSPHS